MARFGTIQVDVAAVMPRCRGCRWWESAPYLPDSLDTTIARGECSLARSRGEAKPDALAFAYESNFWSADLITAADFGCVQWQAKEEGE